MALFTDEVLLTLAGETITIAENYEIRAGILNQPAGFGLRLGHGGVVADLAKRYPENTPFSLSVNGQTVQTGSTDGLTTGESNGACMITFEGRDALAPLADTYVAADTAFSGISFAELVERVLAIAGYENFTRASGKLVVSNEANRRKISGVQLVQTAPPSADVNIKVTEGRESIEFTNIVPGTKKTTYKTVKIQLGTKWLDWLKTQLDRAGLFLWATGDGRLILSAPNPNQDPCTQIRRVKRGDRGEGFTRVVRHQLRRNTRNRYTKFIVYGKGGGRNFGRQKVRGEFVDPEMTAIFGGEDKRVRTHHDNDVKDVAAAEYMARRLCAEANREGWQLNYTLAGHSTRSSVGGARMIWTPDTVVEVDDRELGVSGLFYLENLTMNRAPEATTTIQLMRLQDLVFALEAA